jgi:hypothetical protein
LALSAPLTRRKRAVPTSSCATPLAGEAPEIGNAKALQATQAVSVAEQLARTAPGVTINEVQGNPLQPDVNYRGMTASPLLGTAQGLSVYLDGVRVNQPFGDVVSWDLIPTGAIADIDLVSGAAPQFGRNALGGALVLRTKSGKTDPGVGLEASGGSFGRVTGSVEAGGVLHGGLDWFVAADHFREDGWREMSPSRATRAMAKLGWSDATSSASLTGHFADTISTAMAFRKCACSLPIVAVSIPRPTTPATAWACWCSTAKPNSIAAWACAPMRSGATCAPRPTMATSTMMPWGKPLPAQCGRTRRIGRCRIHRISGVRRNPGQHPVSQMALHRERIAQQRAQREVRRPDQPVADPAERMGRHARSLGQPGHRGAAA